MIISPQQYTILASKMELNLRNLQSQLKRETDKDKIKKLERSIRLAKKEWKEEVKQTGVLRVTAFAFEAFQLTDLLQFMLSNPHKSLKDSKVSLKEVDINLFCVEAACDLSGLRIFNAEKNGNSALLERFTLHIRESFHFPSIVSEVLTKLVHCNHLTDLKVYGLDFDDATCLALKCILERDILVRLDLETSGFKTAEGCRLVLGAVERCLSLDYLNLSNCRFTLEDEIPLGHMIANTKTLNRLDLYHAEFDQSSLLYGDGHMLRNLGNGLQPPHPPCFLKTSLIQNKSLSSIHLPHTSTEGWEIMSSNFTLTSIWSCNVHREFPLILSRNTNLSFTRNENARDVLWVSRLLALFSIPFELKEILLSTLPHMTLLDPSTHLLQRNILLNPCLHGRIGAIASEKGWKITKLSLDRCMLFLSKYVCRNVSWPKEA